LSLSSALAKSSSSTSPAAEAVTAESLGRQLRAALPPLRLHSVSLYNGDGDVLWLSEGALGPDEHSVVLDAIQTLHAEASKSYHESGLEDGRFAMFLPIRAPRGDLVGLVMILADLKNLPDGLADRLTVPKVRTILQRIAVFLRVGSTRGGDTTPASTLPPAVLDQVLTLELVPDSPPAAAAVPSDLMLHVQELIKLRSNGRTRRYEVLARSRRDSARNEVPSAFVSAQGQEGAALDQKVLRELFDWLKDHPQIWDGEPASFSVNLSVGALEDERFLDGMAAALKTANVPAGSIGFEISEFACVQCKPQVQRFMADCEKLGCFVVIDNFTFDSAAFSLLTSKALRMVKLDSKLTNAAMKEKLAQALVVATAQACKVLGIHCIAKRVETEAALEWLEAVGCDLAQGFALEKPLSLETLAAPASALARKRARA
jgi:EAL domain-containing protein (putative c-di-GMP-specific phosphodiesterase class I)